MDELPKRNYLTGRMKLGITPDETMGILDFVSESQSPDGEAYVRVLFPAPGLRALEDQIGDLLDKHPKLPEPSSGLPH